MMLVVGFGLAVLVSLLAWKFGALSSGGAVGATVVGGLTFGWGGPVWAIVLVAFFVGSSLLSSFRAGAKSAAAVHFAKGSQRDLAQVMANGGLGALLATVAGIVSHASPWYPTLTIAYFGALSAATADTWATELGVLSKRTPRLITTGRPVSPGSSGGVTWLGLAASMAGGAFIGTAAMLGLLLAGHWSQPPSPQMGLFLLPPLAALAGLIGSVADSVLGATVQAQRYCPVCCAVTERETHSCGQPTLARGGLRWMTNDTVNFLITCVGAAVAVGAASVGISPML